MNPITEYYRGRMLKEHALTSLDPKRCAKAQELLEGSLPLASFTLPREVLKESSDANYRLKFGVDSEGYVYIHGLVKASLFLECQRCLKPMEYEIHTEFCLSPVSDAKNAATLPECYEAVLMENERLSVTQIVEDELILSLPIAPMHEKECCSDR